jgi:hypothetical protein
MFIEWNFSKEYSICLPKDLKIKAKRLFEASSYLKAP